MMRKGKYRLLADMAVKISEHQDAETYPVSMILTYDVVNGRDATLEQPEEGAVAIVRTLHTSGRSEMGNHDIELDAPNWLWRMVEDDEHFQNDMIAESLNQER